MNKLFTMIMLAIIDSLNPATIATMIIIMPIVKKKWHSLIFVFGTFIVYFATGIIAFLGVDAYLKAFIVAAIDKFSVYVAIIEFMSAVILLVVGISQIIKLVKRLISKEKNERDYMGTFVKMVNPVALMVLSFSSTLMDIPTAVPYFGFVGILSASTVDFWSAIGFFVLYCFVYVLPMIVLYFLFTLIKEQKFNKIESGFRSFINRASEYIMPMMSLLIGILLAIDAFDRI